MIKYLQQFVPFHILELRIEAENDPIWRDDLEVIRSGGAPAKLGRRRSKA